MNLSSIHVVIAGAAAGGAGTALLLARAGASVTLVERVAEPRAIGAGIGLAENGLAVLESVGLGPAIERASSAVGAPRIVNGQRRPLVMVPEGGPRIRMIRRSDLQSILLDAVAAEPRITTRFGVTVSASDAGGTVELQTSGGSERITADLVIGADGVHSRVRDGGDHDARVSKPGISYVRVLVAGDAALGEEAWTRAGLFGSFAVPNGTYVYASASSANVRAALAAKDLDAFRDAWVRAYPASGPILANVPSFESLLVNDVITVRCRRWFDGKRVLVGDAAHAMAPNLGQGANSALVDGAVLLDELRRHEALADALGAYQRRRQQPVTKVAVAAARLGKVAELANPVASWLRDRVLLPIASRLAGPMPTASVLQEPTETLLAIGRA